MKSRGCQQNLGDTFQGLTICIKYGFDILIIFGSYCEHRRHTTLDRRQKTSGHTTGKLIKAYVPDARLLDIILILYKDYRPNAHQLDILHYNHNII